MKIDLDLLTKLKACKQGTVWFKSQHETEHNKVIKKLLEEGKFTWANWLIVRLLDKKQRVKYAIFAAELVLHIFQSKYPKNQRPRQAIQAAKNYLINDTFVSAADAATAAAAYAATAAAAYAATAAAAYAAAADATATAAAAAEKTKIIDFGLNLLKEESLIG